MKRILFVDDQPDVLRGLEEMLDPRHEEWEITVVTSGESALQRIARESYDVIVSDARMPGMDGCQLLAHVQRAQPGILRLLAVDLADREMARRSSSGAHGLLAKPCSPDVLRATLSRGCALQDILKAEKITRLVDGLDTLPAAPSVYFELVEATKQPESSVADLSAILTRDLRLSAKVLQLVNSALFGLTQPVASAGHAATSLGLDTLKAIVLSVQTFSQFDESRMREYSIAQAWKHSVKVASFARAILHAESCDKREQEEGFLAGMMHDCGELILSLNRPDRFHAARLFARRDGGNRSDFERRLFGVSHAALGAHLLNSWGLPMPVVEAVAFHHTPSEWIDLDFSPLCAVHVANALAHSDLDAPDGQDIRALDREYLVRLGLERRLPRWRQVCREVALVA